MGHINEDVIVAYGLSANPPTAAHLRAARALYKAARPEQVWLIVSPQNPLKPTQGMAPFNDRLAMTELMAAPYPWLKASSIEWGLGTQQTSETLKALTYFYPDKRFIWSMGADNLAQFHTWHEWQWIIEHCPMMIFEREPYTQMALESESARFAAKLHHKRPQQVVERGGWCLLPSPDPFGISSSAVREFFQHGEESPYIVPPVREYIKRNHLYVPQDGNAPR